MNEEHAAGTADVGDHDGAGSSSVTAGGPGGQQEPLTVPATVTLPGFTEGPNFHIERPCRARLVRDMPDFGGNIVRLDEEGIRPLRPALARPGNIDDSVDREVGGVHALWAKI